MKQGQSSPARFHYLSAWSPRGLAGGPYPVVCSPAGACAQRHSLLFWVGHLLAAIFSILWTLVSLPFRLIAGIIGVLGRLIGICMGFVLMVVGVALWAGPLFILGVPLFLVGLLLSLRSLS